MIPNKNTFCIAPFKNVAVDSKGNLKVCCVSREKVNYKFPDIEKWYKSTEVKSLRKNLLNGIKDSRCYYCWLEEDNGAWSQRKHNNKHLGGIDPKTFDKDYKKIEDEIQHPKIKNLDSFDLRLGNLCNLKCVMCHSQQSSQLLAEAQLHPELKEFYGDENPKDYVWSKEQNFYEWCNKWLPDSINIKFTGGEPLINPFIIPTLQSIPDNQKEKATLHFCTNLTTINHGLIKILSKFKSVQLLVSVEGTGKVLDYARFPHTWTNLIENFDLLLKNKGPNVHISIQHVIQALTLFDTINLAKYFDGRKIKIHPIFLSRPPHMGISVLKKEIKLEFVEKLKKYKGHNQDFISSIIKFILQNVEQNKNLTEVTIKHLKSIDKVRKNNFEEIIPIDYLI